MDSETPPVHGTGDRTEAAANVDQVDPEARIRAIHDLVRTALVAEAVPEEAITDGSIRPQSVLYMVYWFRRLQHNPEEQARIRQHLTEYIGKTATDPIAVADTLLSNASLGVPAQEYVESLLVPLRTVDLVITRQPGDRAEDREVLCVTREYFPFGSALPGGIIRDEDEGNSLELSPHVFAALRVAGEKVLGLAPGEARYSRERDAKGAEYFLVRGTADTPAVRLPVEDAGGFRYREHIQSVLRPSDPRHIVDTVGLTCEVIGAPTGELTWRKKSAIMSPDSHLGGFAFGHHRDIVSYIIAQTSVEKEREMKEREFVRAVIRHPLESYRSLRNRFAAAERPREASFPELFPVVDRLLTEMFREDINERCRATPLLAGVRDKAVIALRHVAMKNRTFCPYLPTLHAIANAVAFFDLAARQKRGFYETMATDAITEHNPAKTPYAAYHMYRYKYRLDQLMDTVPEEMVIPTFEPLSATDLMRIRGVPIRFIGLARDFLYVDEFEQSPEEFFMHDANHSWRMVMEDRAAAARSGKTRAQLIEESHAFIAEYLEAITIQATDTEEQRELKKLKKIILFEIVHEDARPFLSDVIGKYLQVKEGGAVPFEVPRIDPKTGYMDVVDTLDTGISTLSYVRNKLQHGFYDHVDAQLPQIVGPKYRTAEWIARAAAEMVRELRAEPVPEAQLDADGYASYDWLLRRTCAVGPDNIHAAGAVDPAVQQYGDGARRVNPKRYQAG